MRKPESPDAPAGGYDPSAEMLDQEADIRERLRMDPAAVQEEFMRLPGDLAYVAARHARALGEHLRAKARAKRLWGLIRMQAREELESRNADAQVAEDRVAEIARRKPKDVSLRVTEAMVEELALQSTLWQEVEQAELAADVAREQARGDLLAMSAKRDMLIQLGSTLRAELQADPVVRERAALGR